jgi:uncharacterized circularly permuted ATP-grasp superfamily protein
MRDMAKFFNEMTADGLAHHASAEVREHYREFCGWLQRQSAETIERKRAEAELNFRASASPSPCMATMPAPSA